MRNPTSKLFATTQMSLPCCFYLKEKMTVNVSMESPCAGRAKIDIRLTALKHKSITECLPDVHALTGCNTVSYLFSSGKDTALKV